MKRPKSNQRTSHPDFPKGRPAKIVDIRRLEKEYDQFDPKQIWNLARFHDLISEAVQYGYSVFLDGTLDFSPAEILLDSAVDIFLLLRRLFQEGAKGQRLNTGLGFSEEFQDVLGNPKQFKIITPSKYYWDPTGMEYFTRLAECFIRIKDQKSIKTSFHEMFDDLNLKPHQKFSDDKRISQANQFWWRRQQRRFRRNCKNKKS